MALICWVLVCVFPLYWALATSLKSPLAIIAGPVYVPFVDYAPSLDAWRYILFDSADHPLRRYINSIIVALTSSTLTVLLGAFAAYGLTRYRRGAPWLSIMLAGMAAGLAGGVAFAAESFIASALIAGALAALVGALVTWRAQQVLHNAGITVAILATRILPPVVIVLPIYLMAQFAGLLDTRTVLVLVYVSINLPVALWLLQPVLGETAAELEEAAELDGASRLRILFDIVIPVAMPSVVSAGSLIFLLCWNEYLFSVCLAPDHAMTMPPFLAAQMSVREQQAGSDADEWTHLAAAIVLMSAPLIIFAGVVSRVLVRMTRTGR